MKETTRNGAINSKRIDLYKRNCFVLEAKQSRLSGDKKLADAPSLPGLESAPRGRRFIGPHRQSLCRCFQNNEGFRKCLVSKRSPRRFLEQHVLVQQIA